MNAKRNARNLALHELIGLKVRIVEARNKNYVGKEGMVVDETKNTIVIEEGGKEKIIAKKGTVFEFHLPKGKVKLVGDKINYRPHERTKKLWRKRWFN